MPLAEGEAFDRYTIEALIGEGGMGAVYRAWDVKLERAVALKVVRADPAASPEERARGAARLLREARAAASLAHANAVAIHDVGEVGGTPFIAMELVPGRPLRAYVGDLAVPVATRLRWLGDVARALRAAHDRGLVHRDIKPENVMVRTDGEIKVLDFGLARAFAAAAPPPSSRGRDPAGEPRSATLTRDGSITGTPRYMAPEQLRGDELDARVDQFAWGVLAYELLTGRAPWPGDATSLTLVGAMLHEDPPPMGLGPDVPERVEPAVLRALSKEPGDRFASMGELLAAFEGGSLASPLRPPAAEPFAAEGRSLRGSEDALRSTVASAPRARRAGWLGAVAHAAALAGVLLVRARPARSPAPETPRPTIRAITDLPVPPSAVADAQAEYIAALHALRDASVMPAIGHLVRATERDPSMAAAHLRLPLYAKGVTAADARGHFAKARELRGLLTARDQELLHAIEPSYLAIPSDEAEVTRRLDDLARLHPEDAEIAFFAAAREPDAKRGSAAFARVLAIDPSFALAAWRQANTQSLAGDLDGAMESLGRCLSIAPAATSCLSHRATIEDELGRCAAMEDDARRAILAGGDFKSYDMLARALFAVGAPISAVREALAQKWLLATGEDRERYRPQDEANLAILAGDFVAAEGSLREIEAQIRSSPKETDHADVAWALVSLLGESGKPDRAAAVADGFLRARAGWESLGRWSPRPLMYAAAVHGGLRTEGERQEALTQWLAGWKEGDPAFVPQSWLHGYAIPAETPAEAKAALAAAPEPMPRPLLNQSRRVGLDAAGKVMLLADRAKDAVPLLRRGAVTCSALAAPIDHTRAQWFLGRALESTGDREGACAALRVVLARWGHARPRSVTAERARERARALGCGAEPP